LQIYANCIAELDVIFMNAVVAERRRDLCLVAAESAREAIGSQARWPFNGGQFVPDFLIGMLLVLRPRLLNCALVSASVPTE
jgi:hypothetical protein